jgi:hypothetical protein
MKTNQGTIIFAERVADYGRLRSVLREWGYGESEIQRFLSEPRVTAKQHERSQRSDQSGDITHSVS